jgi:hypothetical protein
MPAIASHQTMGLRGLGALKEDIVIRIKRRCDLLDWLDQQSGCPDSSQCNGDLFGID